MTERRKSHRILDPFKKGAGRTPRLTLRLVDHLDAVIPLPRDLATYATIWLIAINL
jgi:hypothetical protein